MYYAFSCNTLNTDKNYSLTPQRSLSFNVPGITVRWKAITTNIMSITNGQKPISFGASSAIRKRRGNPKEREMVQRGH